MGYRRNIDWRNVDQSLTLFIWVRTSGGNLHDIAKAITELSNSDTMVEECHLVTGEWCLLLKLRTASTATLQHAIDRLREMPHVRHTWTTAVLSSAGQYPLEPDMLVAKNER